MINLMRRPGSVFAVNNFTDLDIALTPSAFTESPTQTLGRMRFSAATLNQFNVCHLEIGQNFAQFAQGFGEIPHQHGFDMILGLNIKSQIGQDRQSHAVTAAELWA